MSTFEEYLRGRGKLYMRGRSKPYLRGRSKPRPYRRATFVVV